MISSYNNNLFSAHNVLKYGSLLNIDKLRDIVIKDLTTHELYILCYDLSILKNRRLYKLIRYLITLEPNYYNSCIRNGMYMISFNIPKNCKNLVLAKSAINKKIIGEADIKNVCLLWNNKAPSTVK